MPEEEDGEQEQDDDESKAVGVGVAVGAAMVILAIGALIVYFSMQALQAPPVARVPESVTASPAPSALAVDESYVQTRVMANGDAVVTQWIRPDEPVGWLTLALPEVPGAKDLAANRVLVLADGAVVAGPAEITDGQATYIFALTTDVEVRYVLSGAVERSASAPGRALAVATSLDVLYAPLADRETRVVHAPAVLSLACTSSPRAAAMPCGAADSADAWRVQLIGPRVADRVIAQLTLS